MTVQTYLKYNLIRYAQSPTPSLGAWTVILLPC